LQTFCEDNGKGGQILFFETAAAREIKILAEPRRPVAGPQTGSANKGQRRKESSPTQLPQDIVVKQLLFDDGS
jgi:hypothetical protein